MATASGTPPATQAARFSLMSISMACMNNVRSVAKINTMSEPETDSEFVTLTYALSQAEHHLYYARRWHRDGDAVNWIGDEASQAAWWGMVHWLELHGTPKGHKDFHWVVDRFQEQAKGTPFAKLNSCIATARALDYQLSPLDEEWDSDYPLEPFNCDKWHEKFGQCIDQLGKLIEALPKTYKTIGGKWKSFELKSCADIDLERLKK